MERESVHGVDIRAGLDVDLPAHLWQLESWANEARRTKRIGVQGSKIVHRVDRFLLAEILDVDLVIAQGIFPDSVAYLTRQP